MAGRAGDQRTAGEGGATRIGIIAGEGKRAGSVFGDAEASAADNAAEREDAAIDRERAIGAEGDGTDGLRQVIGASEDEIGAQGDGIPDRRGGGRIERATIDGQEAGRAAAATEGESARARDERTRGERGAAGVGVAARELQRAGAVLGDAEAGAAHDATEREDAAVDGDRAVGAQGDGSGVLREVGRAGEGQVGAKRDRIGDRGGDGGVERAAVDGQESGGRGAAAEGIRRDAGDERAGIEGGATGVGIDARQGQRTRAVLGEAEAGASDDAAEREDAAVDGDRAVGAQRDGAGGLAEIGRAGEDEVGAEGDCVGDRGGDGGVERAAVDGQEPDRGAAAAEGVGGRTDDERAGGEGGGTAIGIDAGKRGRAAGRLIKGGRPAQHRGGRTGLDGEGVRRVDGERAVGDRAAGQGDGRDGICEAAEVEGATVDGDRAGVSKAIGGAEQECAGVDDRAAGESEGASRGEGDGIRADLGDRAGPGDRAAERVVEGGTEDEVRRDVRQGDRAGVGDRLNGFRRGRASGAELQGRRSGQGDRRSVGNDLVARGDQRTAGDIGRASVGVMA